MYVGYLSSDYNLLQFWLACKFYSSRIRGQTVTQFEYQQTCVEFLPELSLDDNHQKDTVEILCKQDLIEIETIISRCMSYFSSESCLISPPSTSSRSCDGPARTSPSTCHCVALALAPPSCLPWLVVALALVAPFSLCCCLSMHSLCLLPLIHLLFSLAGCCVTSHCATSTSHCLLSCCHLSLTCQLVVAVPLIAPPLPRVSSHHTTTSCDVPAGCHVASHHAALSFARVRDDLGKRWQHSGYSWSIRLN